MYFRLFCSEDFLTDKEKFRKSSFLPLLIYIHGGLPWRASLAAQTVKNPPPMQETWVQSLGQEDPLEKGMTTHFSILAWRTPWMEEAARL